MRRPVLASVGQVLLWFAGVAFIAASSYALVVEDDQACPVASQRSSSVVGGMGMPGRPGSGWNGQESRGSGHGE